MAELKDLIKCHEITMAAEPEIGVICIICGESVRLTPNEATALRHGHRIEAKCCDKCRRAVMRMREQEDCNG